MALSRFPYGSRLRSARIAAGVNVETAALSIDRTAYTVIGYELGRIEPPVHVLTDLAALYGTTVGALLDEPLAVAG